MGVGKRRASAASARNERVDESIAAIDNQVSALAPLVDYLRTECVRLRETAATFFQANIACEAQRKEGLEALAKSRSRIKVHTYAHPSLPNWGVYLLTMMLCSALLL